MELKKCLEQVALNIPTFIDTKRQSHKEIFTIIQNNFMILESLVCNQFLAQKDIEKLAVIYNKNLDRCAELDENTTILYYNYLIEIMEDCIELSESNDNFEVCSNLNKLNKLI